MKKILTIGALLFPMFLSAQIKTEIGVRLGMNISGLSLSSDGKLVGVKYNNLIGFAGGGYAQFRKGKLAIQPEILFSQQGQVYSTNYNSNLRTDLSYINIPVLIKYYPTGGLNVYAGGQFGVLASAKGDVVALNNGNVGQAILNQDLSRYLNSTDFAFVFGAGIDLPWRVSLSIRYNLGLTDVNKYQGGSTDTPSFSKANTQNQVIQLSVGYRIWKLGK